MICPTLYFLIQVVLLQRIPLDFLQGDKFKDAADNYIRPLLTKVFGYGYSFFFLGLLNLQWTLKFNEAVFYLLQGVPSLFSDLSPLYDQPGKVSLPILSFFFSLRIVSKP